MSLRGWLLIIKSFFIKFKNVEGWEDDLCWCPSQCYYKFEYKGVKYAIYLRWRWSDPWTVNLIENFDNFSGKNEVWHGLPLDYWTDQQLENAKKQSIIQAEFHLLTRSKNSKP